MKPGRIAKAVLALALASGGSLSLALASAGAAGANPDGPLCTTSSPNGCAGTADFSIGTLVTQTHGGRTMQWVASGAELKFTGAANRCLQINTDGAVRVAQCSGVNGILFNRTGLAGEPHKYTNRNTGLVLASDGTFGHALRGVDTNATGWLKLWNGP